MLRIREAKFSTYLSASGLRSLMAHTDNFIFVKNGVNDRVRDELK
jgi:hypothetical protein